MSSRGALLMPVAELGCGLTPDYHWVCANSTVHNYLIVVGCVPTAPSITI